jgi:hypothetical protein
MLTTVRGHTATCIRILGRPLVGHKVRFPIPWVYAGFYTVYYKDIGEFQILYSQNICGNIGAYPRQTSIIVIVVSIIQ